MGVAPSAVSNWGARVLTILHRDFIEAFGAIGDFLDGVPCVDSSLCCGDGKLRIRTEGMEIDVPVQGYYDGVIWLTAEATYGLAQVAKHRPPPPDSEVVIADGIMRVGRMKFPVRFEDETRAPSIFVPKDAPLLYWLELSYRHSPEDAAAAGVTEILELARKRMEELINEGAALLEPLGVDKTALHRFIVASIQAQCEGKPTE